MAEAAAAAVMPHVLLFPCPAQGHIRAMLDLAELIYTAGLYVTFVSIKGVHPHFLLSAQGLNRTKFRFRTIPDARNIPDDFPRNNTGMLLRSLDSDGPIRTLCTESYKELLVPVDGRRVDEEWPPITCVIADASLRIAFEVAEEVGVPGMILATNSANSMLAHLCIPELIRRGELPLPEEADMDELVGGVAGMESFLRRRDLPSSMKTKTIDDGHLQMRMAINRNMVRARALILNTSEAIDSLVLQHMRSFCPVTYAPGPLDILLKTLKSDKEGGSSSKSSSIFEEDRSCIAWLDSKPNKSVVYVSFGTYTVVTRENFLEFWHGLVNSGRYFLWVIRPDMVKGGMEASEMISLQAEGAARGYFVKWAPQEDVLAHPAVGCFLTHCGWNSTSESIIAGVPMIGWPFFTDQLIISRFVSEVWKVGLDMKDSCERSIVERMVRQVMDGESAEEFQRSASELAQMVRRDTKEGGSSYTDFIKLVEHIKSLSMQTDEASK